MSYLTPRWLVRAGERARPRSDAALARSAPVEVDASPFDPHRFSHSGITLGDMIREVSGTLSTSDLLAWPPDVFAVTSWVLERSEAYRLVVSPPAGEFWPPDSSQDWSGDMTDIASRWSAHASGLDPQAPAVVGSLWEVLAEHSDVSLEKMVRGRPWQVCVALLTLHVLADQACTGIGTATDVVFGPGCEFRGRAREYLAEAGTLSRIPAGRVRVVPKGRFASGGITLRSLSRHLGASFGQVELLWMKAPKGPRHVTSQEEHSTILLVPWPLTVETQDFRPTTGRLRNMDSHAFRFFEYRPRRRFDLSLLHQTLHAAHGVAERIDAVVLPECALDSGEIEDVEDLLAVHQVPMLVAGVRRAVAGPDRLGDNTVAMSIHTRGGWRCYRQAKHHRWMLDAQQIGMYGLGPALDPDLSWWEAIELPPRSLQVIEMGEGMTLVPLVCEDLARYDGATELLRSIGPTLVVTLLLDGPQLASRWTCRYAGVLSDDPGSSVLTLTSLGMAGRSLPIGRPPSRVVAIWNDRQGGLRELELAPEHHAMLLRTRLSPRTVWTADGRRHDSNTDLSLVDVTQIRVEQSVDDGDHQSVLPSGRTLEGLDHVDLTKLTGWIESLVEAAADGSRGGVEALVRSLNPQAVWRQQLGLPAPQGSLAVALDNLARSIVSHLSGGAVPLEALRAAAAELRSGLDAPMPLTGRTVAAVLGQRMNSISIARAMSNR